MYADSAYNDNIIPINIIDVYGIGRRRCARERVHNNNVNLQRDNKFYRTTTAMSLFVFRVDNARDSSRRRFLRWGVAGSREFRTDAPAAVFEHRESAGKRRKDVD